jgi:hypothetical protein
VREALDRYVLMRGKENMAGCRLQFSLHEIDLPLGVTVIGRGVDCHLAFDDSLVSRRHARIVVGSDRAIIEDLGSRNGVSVNGSRVRKLTQLFDGDRLRIGAQVLVFWEGGSAAGPSQTRPTGELRFCVSCRQPYPRQAASCPSCEAAEQIDEVTLSDAGDPAKSNLVLLVEALRRAIGIGRVEEAERVAGRAIEQVAQMLAAGGSIDAKLLGALAEPIADLTAASHDPALALWMFDVYRATGHTAPVHIVERLADVGEAAARYAGTTGAVP